MNDLSRSVLRSLLVRKLTFSPDMNVSQESKTCKTSSPGTTTLTYQFRLEQLLSEGFSVKIKSGIKKVNLFRWLFARVLFDPEGLSIDQSLVLSELFLVLKEQSEKDQPFSEKWKNMLVFFEHQIYPFLNTAEFPIRLHLEQENLIRTQLFECRVPTREEYFGLKSDQRMLSGYKIIVHSLLPDQRIPAKRFVGVGYRDKGCRSLDSDGTPHWTEVASDQRYRDGFFRDIRSGTWKKMPSSG